MRSPLVAVAVAAGVLLVAAPARAHFELDTPAAYSEQDEVGGPQKSAPCGQADPGQAVVPTGAVSTLMEGSAFPITVTEKVFHPGHYRVQLAADQASLPADPPVTAGSTACGSTTVDANPSLPLLADGLLTHTSAFSGAQTAMVQLPAGMTCDHCVLQVTEFMSDHGLNNPGGCFYHHCAIVTIAAHAPVVDAGAGSGSATAPPASSGCAATGSLAGGGLVTLALGALLGRRRRRG